MIHDAFEIDKWEEFYDQSKYKNLILDTHQYIMVLEANGCKHDLDSYLKAIDENFTKPIAEISKHIDVVCGEWCLFNSLCAGHDTKAGLAQFDKEQNLEENFPAHSFGCILLNFYLNANPKYVRSSLIFLQN